MEYELDRSVEGPLVLTWIGEELTGQMKKYKEAVEEKAVYSYPSCLSV